MDSDRLQRFFQFSVRSLAISLGLFLFSALPSLSADLHYILVDSVKMPVNGSFLQIQANDLDGDSLDEVQGIFRDRYYAYSFDKHTLLSNDIPPEGPGLGGLLTTNWDSDPQPEVLLKDIWGRLSLKSDLLDSGFTIIDTFPEIGGGYLGAPGATMFLRDLNGDSHPDMIVSQLTEYFQFTGRYYETILYHTGDIGAYDLYNNQFLWKYSTPDWNIPPHVPSAQYSTCFDRDGTGRIGVIAWGINDHSWYERNAFDQWVNKYTAKEDLSVFDQFGTQIYFESSSFEYHVLAADFVPELEGEEVALVRYGMTTDSINSPSKYGWVVFCLKFVSDTPEVLWATDCPQPVSNAFFTLDASSSQIGLATWYGTRLLRSSDGLELGQITGLRSGVITQHSHVLHSDSTDQIVQAVGNTLYLFQLQEPTDVEDGDLTPGNWVLDQNYPNPFNPSTTISFEMPKPARVALTVFNSAGQVVRVLIDRWLSAGPHVVAWDGRDANGARVASGTYFYRLRSDGWSFAKKMILIK